jgi:hypothetical protein
MASDVRFLRRTLRRKWSEQTKSIQQRFNGMVPFRQALFATFVLAA